MWEVIHDVLASTLPVELIDWIYTFLLEPIRCPLCIERLTLTFHKSALFMTQSGRPGEYQIVQFKSPAFRYSSAPEPVLHRQCCLHVIATFEHEKQKIRKPATNQIVHVHMCQLLPVPQVQEDWIIQTVSRWCHKRKVKIQKRIKALLQRVRRFEKSASKKIDFNTFQQLVQNCDIPTSHQLAFGYLNRKKQAVRLWKMYHKRYHNAVKI